MQSKGKSMEIIPGIHQNALSGRKVFIEKEKIDFKSNWYAKTLSVLE